MDPKPTSTLSECVWLRCSGSVTAARVSCGKLSASFLLGLLDSTSIYLYKVVGVGGMAYYVLLLVAESQLSWHQGLQPHGWDMLPMFMCSSTKRASDHLLLRNPRLHACVYVHQVLCSSNLRMSRRRSSSHFPLNKDARLQLMLQNKRNYLGEAIPHHHYPTNTA